MKYKHLLVVILAVLLSVQFVPAKEKKEKKKKGKTVALMTEDTIPVKDTTKVENGGFKYIKDFTKNCNRMSGLFNLYQDKDNGKLYLEVTQDKLDKEFIYFAYVSNSVVDAGAMKGGYFDNKVIKISKYFDKLDFTVENTDYYFDPNNPLSKSKNSNINKPLFFTEKIVAKTGSAYLIEADNLFFAENLTQIKPNYEPAPGKKPFMLGTLNKTKSRYLRLKNYPSNTDVTVSYVYENPTPANSGNDAVTDARFVTIEITHSFIEMPVTDYQPRRDDPRVGYFMTKITDQTSSSPVPYLDIIHRWDLRKRDPDAALSEPIVPIVWWIENTTPLEFRPIIKDAILAWNNAFENAGFLNAIQVFEQPDDADWEAEDIRYNVIRWTSSPNPPFGGYGPHLANPRTGQIIAADIMLEFIYLTNRTIYEKLFDVDGLQSDHEHDLMDGICSFGHQMNANIQSGIQLLRADDISDIEERKFIKQALYNLVLHEVGHTLGLNHNFIASHYLSPDEMQDYKTTSSIGISTSVMDYTIPNISPNKDKQGMYFDTKPGTYDNWAIQYGYSQYDNKKEEEEANYNLLSKSNEPEYMFFNDGDDMRYPGKGIDPRVMIGDMSSDAIEYATTNTIQSKNAIGKLLEKYENDGESYYVIRNAFTVLTSAISRNLGVVSRYIGGIYVDRSFINQESKNKPYTPVPYQTQKKAMDMLKKYCFAPDAFGKENEIYNYLQYQRRGYNQSGNEDPKLHDRFLNIQKGVLDQLLHKEVLQRIVDTKLYGNTYDITKVMTDLTNAIFLGDLYNTNTIRQNLQGEYLNRLLSIVDEKSNYSYSVKAATFIQIERIKKLLQNVGGNLSTIGHHKNLLALIDNKFNKK